MKNSGLFLNMAKWCVLGLFFEVLLVLWFVFGVSGIVRKVLKMLVFFPVFWAFVWGIVLFIWVWKVKVFLCFLCLFFFFVLVLFLFCLLCFCFVVGLFLVSVLV